MRLGHTPANMGRVSESATHYSHRNTALSLPASTRNVTATFLATASLSPGLHSGCFRSEGKRKQLADTRKCTRTAHAHTSDTGLGSSSNRISGAAYTEGVCSLCLVPGLYMKDPLKSHILMFACEGSERQSFNSEVGSGVGLFFRRPRGD